MKEKLKNTKKGKLNDIQKGKNGAEKKGCCDG